MITAIKKFINRVTSPSHAYQGRSVIIPRRVAGVYVDHDTALNFSAVFACVRYLSNTVAGLPWRVYKHDPVTDRRDVMPYHPADYLLRTRPNPEMSAFNFKRVLVAHAATWGNAYAEIERDLANRPVALWPITPDRVEIKRTESGALVYEISNYLGPKTYLEPTEIFHVSGMGFDGVKGYSVVGLANRSIGASLAADEFSASFFENGAIISGYYKHPKGLKDETRNRLEKEIKEKYAGPGKAFSTMILEEGMEWEKVGMPLKDAEFLASKRFSVEDVARWFNVPPHKIGHLDSSIKANIETQAIEAVVDSITPWTTAICQEADYKLIGARSQILYFTKMNLKALLQGDTRARADWYQKMRNIGAINVDEIRALEDMNPVGSDGGGEKYVMQGQYTTLDRIGEESPIQTIEPEPDPDGDDNQDGE